MLAKKVERVELTVLNNLGVLGRVIGHIRHEGWNIKRLHIDDAEGGDMSTMEIDIEGGHAKLAQVTDHLLNLDCVVNITMNHNGERVVRQRKAKPSLNETENIKIPDKEAPVIRILTINPGSTSTKFALYDNETPILTKIIRHKDEELALYGSAINQKDYRKNCILSCLNEAGIDEHSIDAIAARGGLLKPIESGTYLINQTMLDDLNTEMAEIHASSLGAIISAEIASKLSIPAYVVDPVVVDEMDRIARITGMPGIERISIFHALNQKAVAKRLAETLGLPYDNMRLIVAHLGGGISVGAHRYGRVIDVTDGLSGEGAFTPERTGGIPAIPLVKMCFSGEFTESEMIDKITKNSGMIGYLGTNDLRTVQKMISGGDEFAALVLDSMAYQVSKDIGALTAVLDGEVDAIILTGGLAYSTRFTSAIKQRVDKLATVHVFPGEDEMFALLSGVLRVLRGHEAVALYE